MTSKEEKLGDEEAEFLENVELHRANSMAPDPEIFQKELEGAITKQDNSVNSTASQPTSFCADMGYMKIELVMFLYTFSYVMRSVTASTLLLDKACLVNLGYSNEICGNLAKHQDIKTAVERLANNYQLGHTLISNIPSVFLGIFIGSWSDKYGRKIPIMAAFVGIILEGLGTILFAAYFHSRIEYFLIPAIFSGLSGGVISIMTVVFSYASDTTAFSKRTMKYAVLEMSFGVAIPLGGLAGGWLFKFEGYTLVFSLSTAGHVLGLICVFLMIKETRGLDNKDSWRVKLRNLWSPQQVVDSFKATIKKRPNKGREQILGLIAAMSFVVLSYASTSHINYYYTYHRYNWTNTQFSTVTAIFSVIGTITMMICVPLFKRFKLGDSTLGLVGSTSLFLKNIATGLAGSKEVYLFANLAGLFGGLCTLAGRSRISKVSSKSDIGKIFAFLVSAEAVLPIAATAIVTQVFNATLEFYPGLIYLVMASLGLIPIGVFIWLARLPDVDYEELYNAEPEEDIEKPTNKNPSEIENF